MKRKTTKKHTKEEECFMSTMIALQADDEKMLEKMSQYIRTLQEQPPKTARKEAKKALIRTGVINKSGRPKDSIVSWE